MSGTGDVMTIGWGIVGTGRHADLMMAPAIAAVDDALLAGVVSRDEGRARDFADRHHAARAYTRYEDLLDDPEVHVVFVASPNALHAGQAVAAAVAGKHVLCDKPLATSLDDAVRVTEACRDAGVRLGIDFQTRHAASSREAQRLISDGAIGAPLLVQAEHGSGRNPLRGWRTDADMAGLGVVNNIGVHVYDLVAFMLGDQPTEVLAMFDVGRTEALETLSMTMLRFSRGALAYVNANQAVPNRQNDFVIYGSEGRLVGRNLTRHMQAGELGVIRGDGAEERTAYSTHDVYQRVVADMNQAVLTGREPLASGLDGLRSVELTEAVAKSAREGRLVALEYSRAAITTGERGIL
jgi:1,5-anhydro-D-fructose reductase (1,5-anhydro-D-mannitol-forming)